MTKFFCYCFLPAQPGSPRGQPAAGRHPAPRCPDGCGGQAADSAAGDAAGDGGGAGGGGPGPARCPVHCAAPGQAARLGAALAGRLWGRWRVPGGAHGPVPAGDGAQGQGSVAGAGAHHRRLGTRRPRRWDRVGRPARRQDHPFWQGCAGAQGDGRGGAGAAGRGRCGTEHRAHPPGPRGPGWRQDCRGARLSGTRGVRQEARTVYTVHPIQPGGWPRVWRDQPRDPDGRGPRRPDGAAQVQAQARAPRSPFPARASDAFSPTQDLRKGPTGLEDPSMHLQLEEHQGIHHPARQAAGGGWAQSPGGPDLGQLRQAVGSALHCGAECQGGGAMRGGKGGSRQ
eukprot:scaffold32866_cov101-Isochrysis_galbana.AAC.1